MNWARDDLKLERVRALLDENQLDAIVVRPKRAYAWTECSYPGSATQFDFD